MLKSTASATYNN